MSCIILICLLTATIYGYRIKSVLATPWLPHLGILKLQDNLISHISALPSLPFLETLDLSFNHITHLSVMQTLASFQHLRSLRVNDNPVQHEPHFYFSLQRLMPWTQHEFGHARHFPTDQQITQIQQEAVLNSPEALQACRQEQWGIRAAVGLSHAFSPPAVLGTAPAREGQSVPALVRPSLRWPAGGVQDGSAGGVSSGTAAHSASITRHGLVMLEGAARRLRQAQVCIHLPLFPFSRCKLQQYTHNAALMALASNYLPCLSLEWLQVRHASLLPGVVLHSGVVS